jgi:hypothetical protein
MDRTAAGRRVLPAGSRAPQHAPCSRLAIHQPRGLPEHLAGQTAPGQFKTRIRCTRTPARPICRSTPPAAKNKSAAGGAPAARGGRACTPKASKERLAFVVPCAWASPSGAAAARQQGALRKRALPHPRPRRRDPQTRPGACHRPSLVGCGRPRTPQHVTPPRRPAAEKSKRQGGSPGPAGAAKPVPHHLTPAGRAAFLPGRACPPLARFDSLAPQTQGLRSRGPHRSPRPGPHPRGCCARPRPHPRRRLLSLPKHCTVDPSRICGPNDRRKPGAARAEEPGRPAVKGQDEPRHTTSGPLTAE